MTTYSVRNPRTGLIDYEFVPADRAAIENTATSMRDAQHKWQENPVSQRVETMMQWCQALQHHRSAIVEALTQDTGRYALSELEFDSTLASVERWCQLAPDLLAEEKHKTSIPFIEVSKQDVPIPLVGVISPWNFPLLLALIDAIPALMAGCAVMIKTSEVTPRFVSPLLASIEEVPELAAVLKFVQGDGQVGAMLIEQVDAVCFTGSVATGYKVADAAAKNFIPAFLELGGKDPAVVLEDADIDRAAAAICWGGLANSGQSCLSIERVYVHESRFNDFVAALKTQIEALTLSFDNPKQGELGPIIAERQAFIIEEHIRDALEKGAQLVCGGKVSSHGGGLWCLPTLLTHVDHSMKIMTEETFAPILPVMTFENEAQAINLANDSQFGLSAAVFSGDNERARTIAHKLLAGAVSINDAALTAIMHEGEKQAFKMSGMGGSRMGKSSLRRFVRRKALIENTGLAWDPWWFSSKPDV